MGTQGDTRAYVQSLTLILRKCRRTLKPGGFLVLVIEPIPGYPIMEPLSRGLRLLSMTLLATYQWSYGPEDASWVIVLGKGGARINQEAPPAKAHTWLIPRPEPDANYGFYEWPQALVDAVVQITIPNGGRILDPFAGKAKALAGLPSKFEVVAVDVLSLDDEDTSPDESRLVLENASHSGGECASKETA